MTEAETSPSDIAAVRSAVQAGVQAAIAAGADRRYVFTGLWSAAIASILDTSPLNTLALALEDYAGATRGIGSNAESPPLMFDKEEREASARIVTETVLGYLEPIHESFEAEGREAFSTILEVIFGILTEVWGAFHLRKNLALQSAAFREGIEHAVVPAEPEIHNRKTSARAEPADELPSEIDNGPASDSDTIQNVDRLPASAATPDAPFYSRHPRREVDIVIEVAIWGGGSTGVFGVAASLAEGDGFPEMREFSGYVGNDPTGRLTPLVACVEALRRLGPPAETETVRLGINADFIVSSRGSAPGLPGEERLWSDLETAMDGRFVEWHVPGGGVGTELGRRSNRMTHERSTQLSKAKLQ